MMWWWGGLDHMGAAGWVGMGLMILFWIVVVVAVVYLIWHLARRESWRDRPWSWQEQQPPASQVEKRDALRILEERYARGEIEREEFLRRKTDLMS